MEKRAVWCNQVSLSYGKSYGKSGEALRDITFSAERGKNVGLIGPIGSGKTTLLRALAGILRVSAGEIRWTIPCGALGYMPASGGLVDELTVRENLEIWSLAYRVSRAELDALIDTLGIGRLYDRKAGSLSSGLKKMVLFACSVAGCPPVVLLDEPFVHLDIESCMKVQQIITDYLAESTVIISSHNLEYLEKITDCLLILKEGKQLFFGTAEELKRKCGAQAGADLKQLYLEVERASGDRQHYPGRKEGTAE